MAALVSCTERAQFDSAGAGGLNESFRSTGSIESALKRLDISDHKIRDVSEVVEQN